MSKAIELLKEIAEDIYQKSEGSCPLCSSPDYPVCGEKKGYEKVKSEEAQEWTIDHEENCPVPKIDQALALLAVEPSGACPSWMGKERRCSEAEDYAKLQAEIAELKNEREIEKTVDDMAIEGYREEVPKLQAELQALKACLNKRSAEVKRLKEQVEYWQTAYKRETGTDIIDKSKP